MEDVPLWVLFSCLRYIFLLVLVSGFHHASSQLLQLSLLDQAAKPGGEPAIWNEKWNGAYSHHV